MHSAELNDYLRVPRVQVSFRYKIRRNFWWWWSILIYVPQFEKRSQMSVKSAKYSPRIFSVSAVILEPN